MVQRLPGWLAAGTSRTLHPPSSCCSPSQRGCSQENALGAGEGNVGAAGCLLCDTPWGQGA